jgi:elongation factor Ts
MATLEQIKEVRARSGVGMDACRKALEESGGDVEQALELLKKRGIIKAAERAGRLATEGKVFSYNHSDGKIVAVVEINCETDFAAKSVDFKQFADLVLFQIVATSPLAVREQQVPLEAWEAQEAVFRAQIPVDVPEDRKQKIFSGKYMKWCSEVCLLGQDSVVVPGKTIEQIQVELSAKLGEKVNIRRFIRWEIGEGL